MNSSNLPNNIKNDACKFSKLCLPTIFNPSVGTPEPGGLQWYPTLKFLKKVFEKCDVKGFDIVELNPISIDDTTAYTMAQLCYKLIGYKYA